MITKIPEDPFSGIVLPPLMVQSMPTKTAAEESVGVQVPRSDTVSIPPIIDETQTPVLTNYPFTATINGTSLILTTGTVNGLVPTNVTSTFTISGTGTEYIQLSVSSSNAQITGSSFSVSATAPSPIPVIQGQPPTSFDFCTHVIVNGVAFRVIGNGSLIFTPYEAWRFAKAMTTPDSMPYDSYYSWRAGLT